MNTITGKPNIIIITADQWRGDCIGYINDRHPVMTPHLNQLAAEGVRFTQCYADCPICMPQRMTLLTGQVASRFGIPHNFNIRTPVNNRESLPSILRAMGGYQTKAVGKMHFIPERARFGFEHVVLHPNDYVNWLEGTEYAGFYRGHGLGGNEVYPATSAVPEHLTHTHWIIDQGINFLSQKDPEAPFFMWMVFEAPHSPFDPPAPYDRMYDNFTIPEPVYGEWLDEEPPPLFGKTRLMYKYDHLSDEIIRESRRRYYGQISHIDYQLGHLFGELKSKGLYENTMIVFTSDHGEHLGDHGVFAKMTFIKGSADVPLIIKPAKSTPLAHGGLEINSPVLTADIFATVLDAAGIKPDNHYDSISLVPLMASGADDDNRITYGESANSYGTAFAMNKNYKYIYYVSGGKEQLFDITKDPDNLKNLAYDAQYESIKDFLKENLIRYLQQFDRPMVKDNQLAVVNDEIDEEKLRAVNPFAWRGPLRYGQGY